jgi:signal peptidase I
MNNMGKKRMKLESATFLYVLSLSYLCLLVWFATNASYAGYTGSMKPTLNGGEIMFSSSISASENLTGKIIKFQIEDNHIVHRVIEDHGDYLVTQGDNNTSPDPWQIKRVDVQGKILYWLSGYVFFPLFLTFSVITMAAVVYLIFRF